MAKASNLLPERTNTRRLKDGSGAAVRVDGIDVGVLHRTDHKAYYWPEQPDQLFRTRIEATDFLIQCLIDRGELDPNAPRRDLRKEAGISDSVRSQVSHRDMGLCQYCLIQGKRTAGTEYDHFIPASAGGGGSAANVQLACSECNSLKRHWHPKELWGEEWQTWGPLRDRSSGRIQTWKR